MSELNSLFSKYLIESINLATLSKFLQMVLVFEVIVAKVKLKLYC